METTHGAPTSLTGYRVEVSSSWPADHDAAFPACSPTFASTPPSSASSKRRLRTLGCPSLRTSSTSSLTPSGTRVPTSRRWTRCRRASLSRRCAALWLLLIGIAARAFAGDSLRTSRSSSTSRWPILCGSALEGSASRTPTTSAGFCTSQPVSPLRDRAASSISVSTSRPRRGSASSEPHSKGRSPPAPTGSDLIRIGPGTNRPCHRERAPDLRRERAQSLERHLHASTEGDVVIPKCGYRHADF